MCLLTWDLYHKANRAYPDDCFITINYQDYVKGYEVAGYQPSKSNQDFLLNQQKGSCEKASTTLPITNMDTELHIYPKEKL